MQKKNKFLTSYLVRSIIHLYMYNQMMITFMWSLLFCNNRVFLSEPQLYLQLFRLKQPRIILMLKKSPIKVMNLIQ